MRYDSNNWCYTVLHKPLLFSAKVHNVSERSGSYQLNKEGRVTAAASCAGGIQFYLY